MDQIMNIVMGASKEYTLYTPVMLLSLFESNHSRIRIYYYHDEPMDELIAYMKEISKTYENEFIPMYVTKDRIPGVEECDMWHSSTWYRYLCLDDLGDTCERVLIMGIDMIITKDIQDFYFQDLKGKSMAAVQDMINMYKSSVVADECAERGKCIEDYVNVDVLLFDLCRAKENFDLKKMMAIYRKDKVNCMDQGVINYYYYNYLKVIKDYKYNLGVNPAFETMEPDTYKNTVDSAAILHFADKKPWNNYNGSYAHKIWLNYARKTKYKDEIIGKLIESLAEKRKEDEKRVYKMDVLFSVMDHLWKAVKEDKIIGKMRELGLNKIIIYGLGKIGSHLLDYCLQNSVDVVCAIDNKDLRQVKGIPVYPIDKLTELERVDGIIVTPVYEFNSIKERLNILTNFNVLSIEDII